MAHRDLRAEPSQRRTALSQIEPARTTVGRFHDELRDIFKREMVFRGATHTGEEDNLHHEYCEQLYWCALLLYLVGDPADVALMWEAKHIDMDTGCGFDAQFLVGAGVEETIRYLRARGMDEIAAYLEKCKAAKDFDDLPGWEQLRIKYFYSDR